MANRILILGATGRTGQLALKYALEKGYAVTVLVHNPDKLPKASEKVRVIHGSPLQLEDMRKAMPDCNYVLSLLSSLPEKASFSMKKMAAPHTLKISIANAITVMKELGITRILTLSSIGVGDSYPYAPWYMKLMLKITNFKIVFADHNAQEELLRNSGLEWTIVRPVGLNNHDHLGRLQITYNQTPKLFQISRNQLAKFFIDNLTGPEYVGKTPLLFEIP